MLPGETSDRSGKLHREGAVAKGRCAGAATTGTQGTPSVSSSSEFVPQGGKGTGLACVMLFIGSGQPSVPVMGQHKSPVLPGPPGRTSMSRLHLLKNLHNF